MTLRQGWQYLVMPLSGAFCLVQDKTSGQYELEPAAAMGCKYHDFTRHDVFSCFHKRSDNAAVVMIGASLCITRLATSAPHVASAIAHAAAVHESGHQGEWPGFEYAQVTA